MSAKKADSGKSSCTCASDIAHTLTEGELEELRQAHSCTLEQAHILIGCDLKECGTPVYVFKKWCKGCNICVELCPKQTLALGADVKVFQAKPDDCTRCGMCELRCPDFAIFVVDKKPKKKTKSSAKE
jgi:2-oxoglutarate ferredoxin oxidoreductase subunit delta